MTKIQIQNSSLYKDHKIFLSIPPPTCYLLCQVRKHQWDGHEPLDSANSFFKSMPPFLTPLPQSPQPALSEKSHSLCTYTGTHAHTQTTSAWSNYANSQWQLAGIRSTKLALPSCMVPGQCEPSWSPSQSWKPPVITSITAKDLATIELLSL